MNKEECHTVALMENKVMKWDLSVLSEERKGLIKENYIADHKICMDSYKQAWSTKFVDFNMESVNNLFGFT